jgi:hypothetical protein
MIAVANRKRIDGSPRFAAKITQPAFVSKRKNTMLTLGTLALAESLDHRRRVLIMKKILIVSLALCIGCSSAALARVGGTSGTGGSGLLHSPVTGGALGTSSNAPGTNSLGTALSSGGAGRRQKGPPLGTGNPAVDREDARVARTVHSICRGC